MQTESITPTNGGGNSEKFGRAMGSLKGIPNVIHTQPHTQRSIVPMIGTPLTFIVQTFRQLRDDGPAAGNGAGNERVGDWIFIQKIDGDGVTEIFCPPEISKVIARQRDALTQRTRKRAARAGYETRKLKGTQASPPRPRRRKAAK